MARWILAAVLSLLIASPANAGTHIWTELDLGFVTPQGVAPTVFAVAIDPTTPSTLYVSTGAYGSKIYKSVDRGGSWSPSWYGDPLNNVGWVWALAIDPQAPATIYAGTDAGLFKSTDGGASWTDDSIVGLDIQSVAIDPTSPATVYAGSRDELYKSTDGFATWTWLSALNGGPPPGSSSIEVRKIVIDQNNPSRIFIAAGQGDAILDPTKRGVWRSTDGGQTWVKLNNGLSGDFGVLEVRAVAIDPNASNVVYAGVADYWSDGGVFKSVNGGVSWTAANSGLTGPNAPPVIGSTCLPGQCSARLISELEINPADSSVLYAGTSGAGVFWTANGANSWISFNNGLPHGTSLPDAYYVEALVVDPATPSRLFAGTYQGLFVRDACGDFVIDEGEQCDDGDTSDGDGCSAGCEVESCYACIGEPSVCSPVPAGTTCNADDDPCTVDKCSSGSGLCEVTAPPPGWSCNGAVEGMVGGPQHLCENGVRDEVNDTCTLSSPSGHSLVIPDAAVPSGATNISIIEKGSCSFSLDNGKQKTVSCVEFEPSGEGHLSAPVTATLRWDNVVDGPGCANRGDDCPVLAADNTRTCEGRLHVYGPGGVQLTDQCGKASAGGAVCPTSTTFSSKCVLPCTGTPQCDPVANTWTIQLNHFSEYALAAAPCNTDVLPTCRAAGKSLLVLKKGRDEAKDRLTWKWLKGEATSREELGDGATSTNYSLCLYAGAEADLVGEATFMPGFTEWDHKGFTFKDALNIPTGIKKAMVKVGTAGKAKAVVKGKGRVLPDPLSDGLLPLPVRVQLLNSSTDTCFEQVYESADVIKNDGSKFKAKVKNP